MTHIRIRASLGGNIPRMSKKPSVSDDAAMSQIGKIDRFWGESLTVDRPAL
jgi:hypothetical protein